ncbi:MAG: NYN domain-containing protein [Dehalococcoidia bacterium]|nr:NYN domain-containing protein [Dehalococcoidia bacterium]
MHKAAVFIDGRYLGKVLDPYRRVDSSNQRRIVEHRKLIDNIVAKAGTEREIIRIYYYDCLPYINDEPTVEQTMKLNGTQRFHAALRRLPRFEVRLGRVAYRGSDSDGRPIYEQKRVDLLLGMDIILHSVKHTVDEVFLITGDSDFIPAIQAVKAEGVIAYLAYGGTVYQDLYDAADERIEITSDIVDGALLAEYPLFTHPIGQPDLAEL